MDAADIAWKLALVIRGAGKRSLLDSYAIERGLADHHVLEVSNEIHTSIMKLIALCTHGDPIIAPQDPAHAVAGVRRRCMLDVSYAGSPLVGEAGSRTDKPAPGERYPAWLRLSGAGHQLLVFGRATGLREFHARWGELVTIVEGVEAGLDAAQAGVSNGGAVLVRPDGFIGLRAAPADDAGMKALDAHLATYLEPNFRAAAHQMV